MPGIALLEWPHHDLRRACIQYMQERGTFIDVSSNSAELMLRLTTKFAMSSRQDRYHYRIRLQAEMSEATRPIKTYLVEHVAVGSSVRWVTASDRDPIEAALQLALDDLLDRIEEDHTLYAGKTGPPRDPTLP